MIPLQPAAQAARSADTEIWFVDLDRCGDLLDTCELTNPRLSDAEIAHAAGITQGGRQRDLWRWAHIALRLVLERSVGFGVRRAPYVIGERGKPLLPLDGAPHFSLAHSGAAALIGVSRSGAIGVDIETLRQLKMPAGRIAKLEAAGAALAPHVPLPPEAGPRRTLQAWVRFEAVAKAKGSGIGPALPVLRAGPAVSTPAVHEGPGDDAFCVRDLAAPDGYAAAVATATGVENPAFLAFPDDQAGLARILLTPTAHDR